MKSICGCIRLVQRQASSNHGHCNSRTYIRSNGVDFSSSDSHTANKIGSQTERLTWFNNGLRSVSIVYGNARHSLFRSGDVAPSLQSRSMMTEAEPVGSLALPDFAPRIKFKRLGKTAKRIILEAPENERRMSVVKGLVIGRGNAGLNTTFRIRRLVAGVGVESLFPLYSPSIKEIKVLDKKKVRRAKLYYLRDKMEH